jgi:hypothetical protein
MSDLAVFGKLLIGLGLFIAGVGLVLYFAGRLPGLGWLGRLPGDIAIERDNFRFYFPITTSIIVSVVASLILWLVTRQ